MEYKIITPSFTDENTIRFTVWAPKAKSLKLKLHNPEKELSLEKEDYGYWTLELNGLFPGARYTYLINDKNSYPDPASLSQPEGVHEASELIYLDDFGWTDDRWKNISLSDTIQYELHTGTFTPAGTFDGIKSKLAYLQELGINTIEILPVSQFSGKRNWGYDGTYPFAAQNSYGGAKKLMELVNECHKMGIATILDVVYNHFGPEGAYISNFGHYFTDHYSTPWGHPINFDGPHSDAVRNYFIQNALMWLRDFHFDGLRLDAVHAIYDFGAKHFMRELAEKVEELSAQTGKPYHLIAESNLNDSRYISPAAVGGYGLDAQWSDDFHHVIHHKATGETEGYYKDFTEPWHLSKTLKDAFVYDGRYSKFRKKTYGNTTEKNKGEQFVIFTQNHDQVGNRKHGERLISLAGFETAKLAAATMFLAPNVPMLFMGEEYGEQNPFHYFVSHLDAKLNKLVREGREQEFSDFFDSTEKAGDPSDPETFGKSKLSWEIDRNPEKKAMFNFYKTLIQLRKSDPVLRIPDKENIQVTEKDNVYTLKRWRDNNLLLALMNYNDKDISYKISKEITGRLNKALDSSDKMWMGRGSKCPFQVSANNEIILRKKSIIIFTNH